MKSMQIEIQQIIDSLSTLKNDGTHFLSETELEGLCDSMWINDQHIDRFCDECGDTVAFNVSGKDVCSSCGLVIGEAPE